MTDKTFITEIPKPKLSEMEQTLIDFKKNIKPILDLQAEMAKIQKARYSALVKQGFSPEQALFLVSKMEGVL